MEMAGELRNNNLKHKSFLIITKYFPHISAFMYALYTLLQFADIDPIILGYLLDYSILPWLYMYLTSYIFRYCYVHRLPLYYILINEILTITDYYWNIPISEFKLLLVHLLFIALLIFGYSYYYVKYNKDMRFISMLGSKEHPVPKKEIPEKITGITKELKNDKLYLQIIGEVEGKCKWTISFDDKTITPTSTETTLILSKSNTVRYTKANKTTVFVTVGEYTSPTFNI